MSSFEPQFVILLILDGWGIAPPGPGNAITLANPVNMNKFWSSYPHTQLQASGEAVGLPRGEDGNTETGHINLGAGRIVYQELERINMSIADGTFFENNALINAFNHAKMNKSKLHLMGLIGAGGVHSNIEHLFALIQMAGKYKFQDLRLHLFTDGRDSPPTAARTYLKNIQDVLSKENAGKIASIMGRYWAMDRDNRWDRTKRAYLALTKGLAQVVKKPEDAIEASYSDGKTDEFIEPSVLIGDDEKPVGIIGDNDAVVFFNFRIDRPRQLTKAFVIEDFSKANIIPVEEHHGSFDTDHQKNQPATGSDKPPFERDAKLKNLYFVTMTEYSKALVEAGANPAFPPEVVDMPLGSVISTAGLRQLRVTESEKERFVTYYFNGLRDKPFIGEEREIIPSPKVPTYDQKPEMSAREVTDTLLKKMQSSEYKLVVVNLPNADMVGHTGNIGPTVKAIEVVDSCVGKIANFTLAYGGALVITADHGNAEEMINAQTGEIDTEHSIFPVPFIFIAQPFLGRSQTLSAGILADVAPTILNALNLTVPHSMTGRNLLRDMSEETHY
jgi:2,3-bisphosphoglycerate-independent phosphoglycerate mutase